MKYFQGTIADKKLNDFNLYDNAITKHKDRISFVEESIYVDGFIHEFFSSYFSNYYTVSPSQDGYLAEEDSVCKLLDILGTYILNANDVTSNRKIEYKFWKSEKEYRDYKDSNNVSATSSDDDGKSVEVIDMFVDKKNSKNQKIVKGSSIQSRDLKEIKEIKALQLAIEYLKTPKGIKEVKDHATKIVEREDLENEHKDRFKYILKNTERYIDAYVKTLRDNQIIIKEAIRRPIVFKSIIDGKGAPNKLDAIDFMEESDVKAMFPYLGQEDLMTDIGIIVFDLNKLLDEVNLSPRERSVVEMYRENMKQVEIGEELDINKSSVRKMEYRIAKKVAKAYEKQVENQRDQIRQKKV